MKRAPVIIIAAIILAGVAGVMGEWSRLVPVAADQQEFDSYEKRDGKAEARADIAKGTPKWKIYGRVGEFETRRILAKEKLGLELDWFEGCIVSEAIERYAFDYNATIRPYLVSVYGEPLVFAVLGDQPEKRPASDDEEE